MCRSITWTDVTFGRSTSPPEGQRRQKKEGNSLRTARYLRRKQTIQSMPFRLLAAHVAAFHGHKYRPQVPPLLLLLLLLLQWPFIGRAHCQRPILRCLERRWLRPSFCLVTWNRRPIWNIPPLFWPPKSRLPAIQFDKGHVVTGRGRPPFQRRGSVPCDDVAPL